MEGSRERVGVGLPEQSCLDGQENKHVSLQTRPKTSEVTCEGHLLTFLHLLS